jgi:hypothetical protein
VIGVVGFAESERVEHVVHVVEQDALALDLVLVAGRRIGDHGGAHRHLLVHLDAQIGAVEVSIRMRCLARMMPFALFEVIR